MNAEEVQRKDGKVIKVSNLEVTIRELCSEYQIAEVLGERGGTGRLIVLEIRPKSGSGPNFVARWDGGKPSRQLEDLDFDIFGVSDEARNNFRAKKGGYSGHRFNRGPDPLKRIYDVKIAIPDCLIFEGTVSFSVTSAVEVVEKIIPTDACGAVVVSPNAVDTKKGVAQL